MELFALMFLGFAVMSVFYVRAGETRLLPEPEDQALHDIGGFPVSAIPRYGRDTWQVQTWPGMVPARTSAVAREGGWRVLGGPERDLCWLLSDEEVLRITAQLLGMGSELTLDRMLSITIEGNVNHRVAEALHALALALEERKKRPILALGRRLGAQPDNDMLSGELAGHLVRVSLPLVDHLAWSTLVVLTLSRPLPRGTVLRHQRGASGLSQPLGDLVLDASELHVTTGDPGALRERICVDEVRGPLLSLLLDHPESFLTTAELVLVRKRAALDVEAVVDQALELAEVLCRT